MRNVANLLLKKKESDADVNMVAAGKNEVSTRIAVVWLFQRNILSKSLINRFLNNFQHLPKDHL